MFMYAVFVLLVVTSVRLILVSNSTNADAVRNLRDTVEERMRTEVSISSTLAPIIFRCETKVEAALENNGSLKVDDLGRQDVILDYVSTADVPAAMRFSYVVGNILRDEWTFSSTTSDTTNPSEWHPGDTAYLTSRLNTQPKRGTFGFLTVATPNGISSSAYVDFTNAVSADCRYLHNNPTPPVGNTVSQAVLPMDSKLPTAATQYNYDTDRDLDPGLVLDKTNLGLIESDPTKFQVWRSGVLTTTLPITGTVLIDIWAAMQNYSTGLVGAVTVFLRDYDPSGPSHVEITNGTVFARDWQEGSGDFVERMALVLGTNYTLLVGHELEAWVVVDNESGQAMWLTYDTDNRPSIINLSYVPPTTSSLLYFHNFPSPPTGDTDSQATLPMSFTTPTASTLFDYDKERDGLPGLQINKGTLGLAEVDPAKYQVWRTNALKTAWLIKGDVLIDIWMSLKDFALDKRGVTTLYLRDYDPSASTYTEIGPGSLFDVDWQGGSGTWVKKTILVPDLNYTVPASHMLEVRLTVENQSDEAMLVAYDTTAQPTVMNFPVDTPVPDFETKATLLVLDGWDEENANTLVNLGSVDQVQTSDDARLETKGGFFMSLQFSDVFIPPGSTIISTVVYVEYHEEDAFTGSVEWKVRTGWDPGPETEWATTIPALQVGVGAEAEQSWDVTSAVNTPTRVNNLELVITNNNTNGKKTNADYAYVIVEWVEP